MIILLFANTRTFWSISSVIPFSISRRWDIFWEFSLDGRAYTSMDIRFRIHKEVHD